MKKFAIASFLLAPLFAFSFVFAQLTDTLDQSTAGGCVNLTKNMSVGAKDSTTNGQVSDLQFFLNDKGYLKTDPTGYFGAATLAAVKAFQSDNGITPNGVVGPITRGKIQDVSCSEGDEPGTLNPTDPLPPQTLNGLSASLSFEGKAGNGASVVATNGMTVTNVDPMALRTWKWSSTGVAYVSAMYSITSTNPSVKICQWATNGYTAWSPWDGSSVTGNRFNGSNSRVFGATYYGCTIEAKYKGSNTSGAIVSSSVKVVMLDQGSGLSSVTTCSNGLVMSPCPTTNNPNQTVVAITSLSTTSAPILSQVGVYGTGLTSSANKLYLKRQGGPSMLVGTYSANMAIESNSQYFSFTVPSTWTTADYDYVCNGSCQQQVVAPGNYQVYVVNTNGTSSPVALTITTQGQQQAGSCPSNATASIVNGATQCSCAAGNTYYGGSCVAVSNPAVPACQMYYIRNTSGACVISVNCASWLGTQCNQSGNTTSCPLGYKVTGTGSYAYCVTDTSVAVGETGTPSGSNINIPNKPGLVCANSPTTSGDSTTANVYTRDNSGNLTLTEICKGNEGKVAGISQRGIQCQINAQGVGATCSSQGSVFINGQQTQWKGNTSGYCYSDSACDNGYSCNTNKKCSPMVQVSYLPHLSQSDLASLPADATSTVYKRTWAGSAWGAWVSQGCIPGLHKEGGACVSDRKACTLNNAAGVQEYNTTTNQWGICQHANTDYYGNPQCNPGYHYQSQATYSQDGTGVVGCVPDTKSCKLSDPYPTQYPRNSSVAKGTQKWEIGGLPSWGSCNISCKGNNIKRGVYADQVGIGSFFYDGSTSNYLEYCAPVSVDMVVENKKLTPSATKPSITILLSDPKNITRCSLMVKNSENTTRSVAETSISGNSSWQVNMQYDDLKLDSLGGTVTATCYYSYESTPFTFTKSYTAFTSAAASCSGSVPQNAYVYPEDTVNVSFAESWYEYSLSNTSRKCEYVCASGYTWTGSSCVSTTSGGTGSLTPTVSLTSYPSGTVTQGTSVQFNLSSTNAKSCSVTGSGGSPVYLDKSANTTSKTVYATPGAGVFTAHATCWSDYNGTGNSASDSVSVTAVCSTGTTWNGTSCVNNTVTCTGNTYLNNGSCSACPSGTTSDGFTCTPNNTYSCAGSVPINATKVSGSDQGLTSSVPYTHVGTSYGATISPNNKCKFSCNNGYTWDGWECKMNNNGTPSAKLSITVGGVEVTSDVIYPKNITYTLTSNDAKSCEVKDDGGITYVKKTDNNPSLSVSGITTPATLNFTAQCWSDFNGGGVASPVATKSITVKCPMGTTWSSTTTSCY